MSEYDHGSSTEEPVALIRDEIMTHDIVLQRMKVRIAEFNRWLSEGVVVPGDDESEDIYERLIDDWPYHGQTASFMGILRSTSTRGANTVFDESQSAIVVSEPRLVRSYGFEVIPLPGGEYKGVYLLSDPTYVEGHQYYCYDEDIFSLNFDKPAPESIDWQIEQLLPDVSRQIREAMPVEASLLERIQGLGSLNLILDMQSFGEYPVIEHLARYIDRKVGLDHRIPHAVSLRGELMVSAKDDDGNSEQSVIEISDHLSTLVYVAPIELAEYHSSTGEVSYIPHLTLYSHSDRPFDADDEEIGIWPGAIQSIEDLRPACSLGRLIREHADMLELARSTIHIDKPDAVSFDGTSNINSIDQPTQRDHIEQMKYLQRLIDAAITTASAVAEFKFAEEAEAKESAESLCRSIELIFQNDWSELTKHTFIAEGTGVMVPGIEYEGFIGEYGTGSPFIIQPDITRVLMENDMMHRFYIRLDGKIWPSITRVASDSDSTSHFVVGIELSATVVDGGVMYRQAVPGTGRTAKDIRVTNYAYVPLTGSATLESLDLYDIRQFKQAMDKFKSKLESAPDLRPLYVALKKLHQAMHPWRNNDSFVALEKVDLIRMLGSEAGGDEVASQLVVDTLSDLLGPDRRISIRGKMLRVSDDTAVEVEGEIAGTVRDVVSLRPGGDTEEPMLYLTPIGYDTQPVYVPLKDIEEFYF
ncbi:MAG: hypothetical protein KA604_01235 [Candidatus Saccharimonas sp.]|nr:hypothetical protein [Candidatus Saccharimonas sp.]